MQQPRLTTVINGVEYQVFADGTCHSQTQRPTAIAPSTAFMSKAPTVNGVFSIDPVTEGESDQSILRRLNVKIEEMSHWEVDPESVALWQEFQSYFTVRG